MSRRRNHPRFAGRLGDLERYGLLALVAALLLAAAFAAQQLDGEGAPIRAMAFGGEPDPAAAARTNAAVESLAPPPGVDAPGGGEADPVVGQQGPVRRGEFDFFEPPPRLPGRPPPAVLPPQRAADAAATRVVRVRRGDTLQRIAQRELGAATRWRALVDWNPGVDPRRLIPGTRLLVLEPLREARAEPPAGAERRLHAVAADDTLESIALRYYGDRQRWIDLLEANRDQLRAPAGLRAGMKIRIP